MAKRVFITAAEVSGDRHAAQLIRALKQLDPGIQIEGFGGPEMRAAGATIHHETVGRAAMLYFAFARLGEMWRLRRWLRGHFRPDDRPDLHICVDSSGVNLHFAQVTHDAGAKVLYYIAPQIWASRPWRIRKIRRCVDAIACILPFEEEYYRSRGVAATFVGHPLFDELRPDRAELLRAPRNRAGDAPPVVAIIAGSRRSEVQANLPRLLHVATRIRAAFGSATFLIPTTAAVDDLVARMTGGAADIERRCDGFDDLVPRCDLCLCKSGTSTLHAAAYGVPMIVVYRVNRLVWYVFRALVTTKKIALVNILAGNVDLVPEYVPWLGSADPLAEHAITMLRHPEALRRQRAKLLELVATLDRPGASLSAARIALEIMGGAPLNPEP